MSKRIRTHTNPLSFHQTMDAIDFSKEFKHFSGYIDFEIGFGKGVFIQGYAKRYPERHIVGIEVRKQAVDFVNHLLNENGISNVLALHGAAYRCLEDCIPDGSIQRCFVFHPDPWIKDRHAKRRVIQTQLLDLLERKLQEKGRVYVSTDVDFLWDDISNTFNKDSRFKTIDDDVFWSTDYLTHWSMFSELDKRNQFFGSFECKS